MTLQTIQPQGGHRPADVASAIVRTARHRRYLMCPPTYFAVDYEINPWMRAGEPVDVSRAMTQWDGLFAELLSLGHSIELMSGQPGLPDMVFAANGGIVVGERALASRFRHPQRNPETPHFVHALRDLGYTDIGIPQCLNEGQGDFLCVGNRILAGYGFRSEARAVAEVEAYIGRAAVGLELVDPRFYHLDTALAVLDETTVAYWPGAFSLASQRVLRELWPGAIIAPEKEAALLGLNMISDGRTVLIPAGCPSLIEELSDRGFVVREVDLTELRKAGGGPKCCVLELPAVQSGTSTRIHRTSTRIHRTYI